MMTQETGSLEDDRGSWQVRYEQGQTGWDRGATSPALLRWLDAGCLDVVKTVVVPGCGRGHEVVELARRGFDVTAIDFAPAAIGWLSRRLADMGLSATLVSQSVLEYQPKTQFDAIYEQTCICALEPRQWADYEKQLASWVKPSGKLFALFMQSNKPEGPPFHCDIDTMREIFAKSRWEWPTESMNFDHPAGLQEVAHVIQRKTTDVK